MGHLWILWLVGLLMLAACSGNSEQPAEERVDSAPAGQAEVESSGAESAADIAADTAADAAADAAANAGPETVVEPTREESETDPPAGEVEDTPETAGAEDDTNPAGLPVNPDPIVPGEPFIVEGVVVNASMIPADAPQFLIEGDNGVRFRLDSQPADEIFTTSGGQLLPHQFGPGIRVRATALLPADATAADVATTGDLVVIQEE